MIAYGRAQVDESLLDDIDNHHFRLAFARQREMSMRVGMAMAALPECSAQGISNIAWALSKIGGELFYLSEMDRVAQVAVGKVRDFNSQNVANVAGAFASMLHYAPNLFEELSERASNVIHTFREQELAQFLWAYASLHAPADSLLDALGNAFKDVDGITPLSEKALSAHPTFFSEPTRENILSRRFQ
ncbi:hypothetical protein Scep_002777 [Stephania cephalantha]|uniref:Uncharacterized protein n=1 Tax=Stephania cephalantha TaxID=152367 RepID=A0AAP0LAV3_9MAGN